MSFAAMYALIGVVFVGMVLLSYRIVKVMVFPSEYTEKNDFGDWSLSCYETGEVYNGRHCK